MQLRVIVLGGCRLLHVYWWFVRQGIDAGECISGSIFRPMHMMEIHCELGDEVQLADLPCNIVAVIPMEGKRKGAYGL